MLCTYVRIYMYVRTCLCMYVCMYVQCMNVCVYVCVYNNVCVYVCMHVRMNACIMYVHVCVYGLR